MFNVDTGNCGAFWALVAAALFVCLGTTPQAHAEDNKHTLTTFTQMSSKSLNEDTDHFLATGTLEIEGRILEFGPGEPPSAEDTVSPADGVLCPQEAATSESEPEYVFNEEGGVGCKIEGNSSARRWDMGEGDIWRFWPLVSVKSFRPKTPSSGNTYSGIQTMKVGWAQVAHIFKHDEEEDPSFLDEHRSSSKTFKTKANGDPTEVELITKARTRGNANRHETEAQGAEQHFDAAKLKLTAVLGGRDKPIDAENAVVEVEVLHDKKPTFLTQVVPTKETKWLIANVEFAGCFRAGESSAEVCSIQFGAGDQWALASVIDGDDPVTAFRAKASAFSNGVDSARLENLQNGNSFGMAASESGSGVFDEQFSGGFHFRLDTDQGDESAFSDLSAEAGIFEVDTWDNGEGYAEFSAEAEVVTLAMADNADPFLSQMFDTPLDEGVLLTLRWPLDENGDPLSFGSGSLPPDDNTVELVMTAVPEPGVRLAATAALGALVALRRAGRRLSGYHRG